MEKFWLEYRLKDLQQTLKALEMSIDFVNTNNGKIIDEERNSKHEDHINTTINTILIRGNLFTGVDIQVNDKIMTEIYKLNKDILKDKIKKIEEELKKL